MVTQKVLLWYDTISQTHTQKSTNSYTKVFYTENLMRTWIEALLKGTQYCKSGTIYPKEYSDTLANKFITHFTD